jgi:hypothetical protein
MLTLFEDSFQTPMAKRSRRCRRNQSNSLDVNYDAQNMAGNDEPLSMVLNEKSDFLEQRSYERFVGFNVAADIRYIGSCFDDIMSE